MKKIIAFNLLIIFIACVFSCSNTAKKSDASLYDKLGQAEGIDSIVRELIYVIAKDERVKERFRGANMERFKKGLSDYICQAIKGPCQYAGESMQVVHAGHNYTDTEFNSIVADLIEAMNRKKIPVGTQNQLLSVLAPTYKDVIHQ